MNLPAPFSENQNAFFWRCFDSWFNVAEGGKRGGKNVLITMAYCSILEKHPGKIHLIAGVSTSTARLNILDCDGYGMMNFFEGRCRTGQYQNRDCLYVKTPMGEKIVLVSGGGKAGDERLIKGNTYSTAYITEANECHPDFIQEVFDRTISSQNRKVFHDLNPKSPNHWYYDILSFHEEQQASDPSYGYNYGHFTIADNMSISDAQLRKILKTYDKTTVWYARNIKGERRAAEGLVYDMFDPDIHLYGEKERPKGLPYMASRFIACDYGTTNPFVLLDIYDDGEAVWVDREYRWDSRDLEATGGKQKTDGEYARDYMEFMGEDPQFFCPAIVDPSAASFIQELSRNGVYVPSVDNDVSNGIRRVSSLLWQRTLRIHKRCKGLIGEMQSYSWDTKAALMGVERPVKTLDHGPDALRYYVNTCLPKWRYGE